MFSRRELERSSAKLEAQIEFRKDEPVETARLQKTIEEIRAVVKPLLEEEEFSKVKAGIQRIATLVETILKPHQGEPRADFNKEHQALLSELKRLDGELEDLGKKEREEQKLLEGFNQNFRRAYEEVERERKELEKLRNEENQILLRKERAETRLADLREELAQIGLDFEKLKTGVMTEPHKEAELPRGEEAVLKRMFKLRSDLAGIGEVDEALVKEAKETEERYQFLTKEVGDMERAVADLKNLIQELDQKIYGEFNSAVKTINEEFTKFIKIIFGGGKAKLIVQTNELNDAGIDIEVSLPKKKVKGLEVLSGGERSLVSIAALFALISVSPPPFLVLDEVDAALDEDNARRFAEILKDFSKKTQFVVVTHNRVTMEAADVLYGVTMSPDGTSKVVSLKLST
ncbi:MAG: AAA family ATPase [Patescibacteria group bacterium]